MRRRRLGWLGADWQWTVLGIALILAFWEAYGEASNPFLFPSLDRVLDQLNYYVTSGELVKGVVGTLELLLTGLALGSAAGIVAGLILGSNRTLGEIFAPFLQAGYATPRIALIPLIIIWFGVSFRAQVVLVFLSCVFEVTAATEAGVREVGEHLFEVARSFRLPSWKLYHTIIIPGSVTYIVSGIRLGLSHAFVGAIGAEIFMEASGVGDILKTAMQSFRTDRVLAIIVVLAAFSSILVASMRFAERRMQPWRMETFQ